tara:strand:- start:364 stop:768 length:405 start_codon:yes stop_codon:yes gene_type:complete
MWTDILLTYEWRLKDSNGAEVSFLCPSSFQVGGNVKLVLFFSYSLLNCIRLLLPFFYNFSLFWRFQCGGTGFSFFRIPPNVLNPCETYSLSVTVSPSLSTSSYSPTVATPLNRFSVNPPPSGGTIEILSENAGR